MQTTAIPVCDFGLFGDEVRHFWMDDLKSLLQRFPILEDPHKQHFFMLLFIDDAQGEVSIDNQKINLDGSKVIVIKPRSISSIHINSKAKGKIICFTDDFFSLRYNNNILNQFSFLHNAAKSFVRLNEKEKNKWIYLLEIFFQEFKFQKRETVKILRSYLNIFLFELERLSNPQGFVPDNTIKQQKVREFEKLIDLHFKFKKMPSAYADLLHISPNYLNKICKEISNCTAGDLIRKRIILEAQRLLHYTNHSVNEIADQLGFESTSYFVTFFKKQINNTPEQFRKASNE
ncbi:AraC family transcriptional regulator [Flavobacterium cheongpyeongense]|uniref:AraC family transcriptional regulator n=1 Tax=Flavobacterium cheongpyeongense TaxID=2212651 RepID=A0A2V4BT35_9FLAO|nr:helix-turn-helix domain-containing protein [Flavobacterium cheongpyeongense]PXY42131.1 AraC family transcriptional regulator [Flavobacterium cheongpyeongense]